MSLIATLKANATVLKRQCVFLSSLELQLPAGRTRDAVEQAELRVIQAARTLDEEAAALERYAAEL